MPIPSPTPSPPPPTPFPTPSPTPPPPTPSPTPSPTPPPPTPAPFPPPFPPPPPPTPPPPPPPTPAPTPPPPPPPPPAPTPPPPPPPTPAPTPSPTPYPTPPPTPPATLPEYPGVINSFSPSESPVGTGTAFLISQTKDSSFTFQYKDVYDNVIDNELQLAQQIGDFSYRVSLYTTGATVNNINPYLISGNFAVNQQALNFNFLRTKNVELFRSSGAQRYYNLLINVKNEGLENSVLTTVYHIPAKINSVDVQDFYSGVTGQIDFSLTFDDQSVTNYITRSVDVYTGASLGDVYSTSGYSLFKNVSFLNNAAVQNFSLFASEVPNNTNIYYQFVPYDDFGNGFIYSGGVSGYLKTEIELLNYSYGIPPILNFGDRTGLYFSGLSSPQNNERDGGLIYQTGSSGQDLYLLRSGQWKRILSEDVNDSRYALQSATGNFVTTAQTGSFVVSSQTGAFLTTGAADNRYALQSATGNFVATGQTGVFLTDSSLSIKQIYIDAASMLTGVSGATTGRASILNSGIAYEFYSFDPLITGFTQFNFPLNDYNLGPMRTKFYWTATGFTAGNVVWGLQCRGLGDSELLNSGFAGGVEVIDSSFAGGTGIYISTGATFTPSGNLAVEDMYYFRAYRNASSASDTLPMNARLLGIAIQYTGTSIYAW